MKIKLFRQKHSTIQSIRMLLQKSTDSGVACIGPNDNVYSIARAKDSVSAVSIEGLPSQLDGLRTVKVEDDDVSEFESRLERLKEYQYCLDVGNSQTALNVLKGLDPRTALQDSVLAELLLSLNQSFPWRSVFMVKPHGKNAVCTEEPLIIKVWTYTLRNYYVLAEQRIYRIKFKGKLAEVQTTVGSSFKLVKERSCNFIDLDKTIEEYAKEERLYNKDSKWIEGYVLQRSVEPEQTR